MTSPFRAHLSAIDRLKDEVELTIVQIQAPLKRCQNELVALAGSAVGPGKGPAAPIYAGIGDMEDRLNDAINSARFTLQGIEEYRQAFDSRP